MSIETISGKKENSYPSSELLGRLFENLGRMSGNKKRVLSLGNSKTTLVIRATKKREIIFSIDSYNNLTEKDEYSYPHEARMYFLRKGIGRKFDVESFEGISFNEIPTSQYFQRRKDPDKAQYLNSTYKSYMPTESEIKDIVMFFEERE